MSDQLHVAIDAPFPGTGVTGGVEQFTMGLIIGLGKLSKRDLRCTIIAPPSAQQWLERLLQPHQQLVVASEDRLLKERHKQLLGPLRAPMGRALRKLGLMPPVVPREVPDRSQEFARIGADVVHFPHQSFARTGIPSVYDPHDLQHLHYPEFFSPEELARRQLLYRAGCKESAVVICHSIHTADDLVTQYAVDRRKVHLIHHASPLSLYPPIDETVLARVKARLQLPEAFALYPAQTWPHKNHPRLIEAIQKLRDQHGVGVHLICTGHKNRHWPALRDLVEKLNISDLVKFTGFVDPVEIRALYEMARLLVFPSLFEGTGMVLLEAFEAGLPVVSAEIPPLTEYGGDAVLQFDPLSSEAIADALLRAWTNSEVRTGLVARGQRRVEQFSWSRVAEEHLAAYTKAAG